MCIRDRVGSAGAKPPGVIGEPPEGPEAEGMDAEPPDIVAFTPTPEEPRTAAGVTPAFR